MLTKSAIAGGYEGRQVSISQIRGTTDMIQLGTYQSLVVLWAGLLLNSPHRDN